MISSLGLTDRGPGAQARPADTTYALDIGAVVGRSFRITLANLWPCSLAGLVIYAPSLLLVLLAAVLPLSAEGSAGLAKLGDFAERLLSIALVGGTCHAAFESLRGRSTSAGAIIGFGFGHWGRVFVVSLLSGVLLVVSFVLCVVPVLFVLPALWLVVPIALAEDETAGTSISRSRALTEGNRLRVLGVVVLSALPLLCVAAFVYGSAGIAFVVLRDGAELSPRIERAIQLVVSLLLIPFECFYAVAPVVAYHELRVHREGVGLDELVRVFE